MQQLETSVMNFLEQRPAVWSVYVKNLATDETLSLYDQPMEAASLIKLYVMGSTFARWHTVVANDSLYYGTDGAASTLHVQACLEAMVIWSDNEAYNELVRLHSASHDFNEGCVRIQEALTYPNTGIYHSLLPSETPLTGISDAVNHTSVSDCGVFLEALYRGQMVSPEASQAMWDLLRKQYFRDKIPAGLPESTSCANKTGENDNVQHDVAIVEGPKCDYILCVMVEAVENAAQTSADIAALSALVYETLNAPDGNEKTF